MLRRISGMWDIMFRRKCDSGVDEMKAGTSEDTDVGEENGEKTFKLIIGKRIRMIAHYQLRMALLFYDIQFFNFLTLYFFLNYKLFNDNFFFIFIICIA